MPATFAFSTGDTIVTVKPGAVLQPNTAYVLTVAGVKDAAGAQLSAPLRVNFSTGPTIDLVAPAVLTYTPQSQNVTGTTPVSGASSAKRSTRFAQPVPTSTTTMRDVMSTARQ